MAHHHNVSADNFSHIHEKRSLSGAYGEKTRSDVMIIVEWRKEARNCFSAIQGGVCDNDNYSPNRSIQEYIEKKKITWLDLRTTEKKLALMVCKNHVSKLCEEEYDGNKFQPWKEILSYIKANKKSEEKIEELWDNIGITEKEFYFYTSRKWLSDIQTGACDNDIYHPNRSLRKDISEGNIKWADIGTNEKALDFKVCKNQLQQLRNGNYDTVTSYPESAILYHIQKGKVTWQELGITEDQLHLLTVQKWISDIKKGIHIVKDNPSVRILQYIEAKLVTWDDLRITEKDLNVIIARKWISDIEIGEYDAAVYFPCQQLLAYIDEEKVTQGELGCTEKWVHLRIVEKWFSDIEKGIKDDMRYAPWKNLLAYIGRKMTLSVWETESA